MSTVEELLQSQANVMQELALGQLTLNQAQQIFSLIEARRRLLETQEIEERLHALEERMLGKEPNKAA